MAHTKKHTAVKSAVKKATPVQRKKMIKILRKWKTERTNKKWKKKMGKKGGYA